MSRPCVCGGSNENCRYCNGLGTIRDNLADALVTHARRTDPGKDEKAYRVSNDIGRFLGLRLASGKPLGGLVPCPIPSCTAQLRAHRVEKHLKKVHSNPPHVLAEARPAPQTEKTQSERQHQSVQQLVSCPVEGCNAKLNPNHIKRHIRKAHPKRLFKRAATIPLRTGSVETRAASAARYIVRNSIPDGTPKVSSYGEPREKNLDATKDYAHAYREHGRFGSHPSHDGFDGESGPD